MKERMPASFTVGVVLVAFGVCAVCAGCRGEDAAEHGVPVKKAQPVLKELPPTTEKGEGEKREIRASNPPMLLLKAAVLRLDLAQDDRRSLRKRIREAAKIRGSAGPISEALVRDLAKAVEGGEIPAEIFGEYFDWGCKVNEKAVTKRAEALEYLHGILSEKQRSDLISIAREAAKRMIETKEKSSQKVLRKNNEKRIRRERRQSLLLARLMRGMELREEQVQQLDVLSTSIERERKDDSTEVRYSGKVLVEKTAELCEVFSKASFSADDWENMAVRPKLDRDQVLSKKAAQVQSLVDILNKKQQRRLAELLRSRRGPAGEKKL